MVLRLTRVSRFPLPALGLILPLAGALLTACTGKPAMLAYAIACGTARIDLASAVAETAHATTIPQAMAR